MSSRLRRIFLVNTRTSATLTSGAINLLDLRGHAAVTGANNVGKTTTLQLIPLFFGSLPSHVAESGGSREPMLRFVLPSPESALVFEYQRGASDDDIRCTVLRRQAGSDAGEYRLLLGAFDVNYFIAPGDDGSDYFLDDARSVEAARALGVTMSTKLSASDYRHVLLGLRATNQDAVKLRRMSVDYSFSGSNKSLPNLDRLIIAVVKEHLNFRDFVQIAVTMIRETATGSTTDRNKVQLRQTRAQLQRWLSDRRGFIDAMALGDKVAELKEDLARYDREHANVQTLRTDLAALAKHRQSALAREKEKLDPLIQNRMDETEKEKAEAAKIEDRAKELAPLLADASQAMLVEEARANGFVSAKAEHWRARLGAIPGLQTRAGQLTSDLANAEAIGGGVSDKCAALVHAARVEWEAHRFILEAKKAPLQEQTAQHLRDLRVEENAVRQELDDAFDAQVEQVKAKQSTKTLQLGQAQQKALNPVARDDTLEALTKANARLLELFEQVRAQEHAAGEKATEVAAAAKDVERLAGETEAAHARSGELRSAADAARALLTPEDASLLSAFRGSPNARWKLDIAKIVNPALLHRCDLAPVFDPQINEDGAFGWSFDIGALPSPAWTNDDALREQMGHATDAHQESLSRAREAVARERAAYDLLNELAAQKRKADDDLVVVSNHQAQQKVILAQLQQAAETEKQQARGHAAAAMDLIQGELTQINKELNTLKERQAKEATAITTRFSDLREDREAQLATALASIEALIVGGGQALDARIQDLTRQKERDLAGLGVDTERLRSIEVELNETTKSILEIETKRALVAVWEQWLADGGPNIAMRLQANLARLRGEKAAIDNARAACARARDASRSAFNKASESLNSKIAQFDRDVTALANLTNQFGGEPISTRASLVDPLTTVEDMGGRIGAAYAEMTGAEASFKRGYRTILSGLTAKENNIADMVDRALAESADKGTYLQAKELCFIYAKIPEEIAPNLHADAQSMLENIWQFKRQFDSFNEAIHSFNKKLKEGLVEVKTFERVKDFSVEMKTDFAALGYMKKVEEIAQLRKEQMAMGGAVRAEASGFYASGRERNAPSDSIARALKDFMEVLGSDGTLEVDFSRHISLSGSVTVSGESKKFQRESDMAHLASNGTNGIILITLLSGMLNMIRGEEDIFIPWTTDEVSKFDSGNFRALMQMLSDNKIDVISAAPKLTPSELAHFGRSYNFSDKGKIAIHAPSASRSRKFALSVSGQELDIAAGEAS